MRTRLSSSSDKLLETWELWKTSDTTRIVGNGLTERQDLNSKVRGSISGMEDEKKPQQLI